MDNRTIQIMLLCVLIFGDHRICFGMEQEDNPWWVSKIQKDKSWYSDVSGIVEVVPPDKATLKIYIKKQGKVDVSYGELIEKDSIITHIKLNVDHFLEENKKDGNLVLRIYNMKQQNTQRELYITSWKILYGPEEHYD